MTTESSPPDPGSPYEEIAKLAQHFLAQRPVVVLGTGATIPHGLPSMTALADGLLAAITDHPEGWGCNPPEKQRRSKVDLRPPGPVSAAGVIPPSPSWACPGVACNVSGGSPR